MVLDSSPLQCRVTCGTCRRSILWPADEQAPPICMTCWDRAADEDVTDTRGPSTRYPWTPEDIAIIARETDPFRRSRHRMGRIVRDIAERYGVSARTIYRVAALADEAAPVVVGEWGALFVRGGNGQPPRQLTAWQLSTPATR